MDKRRTYTSASKKVVASLLVCCFAFFATGLQTSAASLKTPPDPEKCMSFEPTNVSNQQQSETEMSPAYLEWSKKMSKAKRSRTKGIMTTGLGLAAMAVGAVLLGKTGKNEYIRVDGFKYLKQDLPESKTGSILLLAVGGLCVIGGVVTLTLAEKKINRLKAERRQNGYSVGFSISPGLLRSNGKMRCDGFVGKVTVQF